VEDARASLTVVGPGLLAQIRRAFVPSQACGNVLSMVRIYFAFISLIDPCKLGRARKLMVTSLAVVPGLLMGRFKTLIIIRPLLLRKFVAEEWGSFRDCEQLQPLKRMARLLDSLNLGFKNYFQRSPNIQAGFDGECQHV
jgi:hypothetical protein